MRVTSLHKLSLSILVTLLAMMLLLIATGADAVDESAKSKFTVDDHSFKCISAMTPARHFYVDNLLGNLEGTLAVAKSGVGDYPEGSVVQLVPTEIMVKHEKGFNAETRDWEFFLIKADKDGSKILSRGFAEVNNQFGMNCFACHIHAKPQYDFICEQGHGCDPIPLTRPMLAALQRTDPRCMNHPPLSAEDAQALKDLGEVFKSLKGGGKNP